MLDNERCIVCSRCVRFTREISKSHALGIQNRGDGSLVRAGREGKSFDDDPYSDNVIDICPVGALLGKQFLHKARVWYLKATPSVCPGCSRGCTVDIWHRKPEWKLNALDPRENTAIARVTPRENPAVNGPWICNKGRDLAQIFERPRAQQRNAEGSADQPRRRDRRRAAPDRSGPAADSAGLELGLERGTGGVQVGAWRPARMHRQVRLASRCRAKRVEDDLLIRADKNPNMRAAQAAVRRRATTWCRATPISCWSGARARASPTLPRGAKAILLGSYLAPENGHVGRLHSGQHPDRARGALHELRRGRQPLRTDRPQAGRRGARRATVRPAGRPPPRRSHDPGPRRSRLSSSLTRFRC